MYANIEVFLTNHTRQLEMDCPLLLLLLFTTIVRNFCSQILSQILFITLVYSFCAKFVFTEFITSVQNICGWVSSGILGVPNFGTMSLIRDIWPKCPYFVPNCE